MTNIKVPSNIEFDSKVLRFHALRDLGIDEKITIRVLAETKFEIGDWVNRNEEITNIKVQLYERERKPKFSFRSDNVVYWSFSFKSPISGLVIGHKRDYLVESPWGYSLFGQKDTFPVLLVPKYEPQATNINSSVYSDLWGTLKNEWPRMHTWDRDKGDIRMGELYTEKQIDNVENRPEFTQQLEEFSDIVDKEYRSEWWSSTDIYVSTIEHLRANDLILRDKLLHLVKDNYKEG